jgi:large subunit ribosomal protein L15
MNQLSAKFVRALTFGQLSSRALSSAAPEPVAFLRLNTLQDNPGAVHKKRRVGRGIGSSKGKTSGRGHKGQKARSGGNIHPSFEGGQTKFYKLVPKRGFNNKEHEATMVPLNVGTLQMYIDMGRIDPNKEEITLYDLQKAGLFKANAVKQGVKLLGDEKSCPLQQPIHLKVSRASKSAIDAVEKAGGTVTTVHYNRLALRAVMRPEKFEQVPRFARPPPKYQPYYTSWDNRGYLNPQVQIRNWLRKNPAMEEKFDSLIKKNQKKQEES